MKELAIEYSYEEDYIHAIVEGKESLQHSIQYWIDLLEEARIKNYKKILVEEKLKGILPKSDIFRFIKEIIKIESKHIRKIAFVDDEKEHLEANEFGATLMLQKGINIMIFKTKKDALSWLNH